MFCCFCSTLFRLQHVVVFVRGTVTVKPYHGFLRERSTIRFWQNAHQEFSKVANLILVYLVAFTTFGYALMSME